MDGNRSSLLRGVINEDSCVTRSVKLCLVKASSSVGNLGLTDGGRTTALIDQLLDLEPRTDNGVSIGDSITSILDLARLSNTIHDGNDNNTVN